MRRVVCVLAVLGLLAGCGGGDDGGDEEGTPASESDSGSDPGSGEETSDARSGEGWTILQYQMADTNLEEPMMADLVEMAEVGSQEGLNLVGLVDRSAEESDEDLLNIPNWDGAKRLGVDAGGFTELEDIGELNMGDPATLTEFIATGVADNPAARILGHRTTYSGLFENLGTLEVGDQVIIVDTVMKKKYTYSVTSNGNDIRWDYKTNPVTFALDGKARLMLMTCYPPGKKEAAFITHCELVSTDNI